MATEVITEKQSRIGKLPIALPKEVELKVEGRRVVVKGPKGQLERQLPSEVQIEQAGQQVQVKVGSSDRKGRSLHGLSRSLLKNMVDGVSKGYERTMEIIGVGYRVELKGKGFLLFTLGYSHPILFELPSGVTAEVSKDGKLKLLGIDKEKLGLAAAKIRSLRAPEPYKGKGVKYLEEVIVRKAGKAAAR
jgi:large subunit ribosomal protein L6